MENMDNVERELDNKITSAIKKIFETNGKFVVCLFVLHARGETTSPKEVKLLQRIKVQSK